MRVLITGAQGQLGRACKRVFKDREDISLVLADIEDFDLLGDTREIVEFITDTSPDVVLHAGAYTDVDGAEDNPEMAMEINAEGTKKVARGVRNINSRMVYISTDYVFNGKKDAPYTEEDKPDPISVYGESKYRGELYLAETLSNYSIVRTAWLYSHQPQSFVKKILKVARERGEVNVVDDQRGSPTYVDDLAFHLIPLLKSIYRGIFNITNSGSTTWYGFAVEIFKTLGMDEISVNPVRTEEFPLKAQRPENSILSIEKYEGTIGIEMPDWKDGLLRFIEEYGTRL